MGNEQAVHKLSFDGSPLPGMTVDVQDRNTGTWKGVVVSRSDSEGGKGEGSNVDVRQLKAKERPASQEEDSNIEVLDAQAGFAAIAETTVMLQYVTISATPRIPFSCAEEEASFAWVAQRARVLYHEHRANETADRDAHSTVVQFTPIPTDAELNDLLLKHDSYLLGFLQVATKCKGATAAWSELNLEAVAHQVCASLEYRIDRGVLKMHEWPSLSLVRRRLPGGLFGKGTECGRPFYWMMANLTEWSNLDKDTIEKSELQIQEQLSEALTVSRQRDLLICVNLEGMGQTVMQYYPKFDTMASISEKYYPGRAHKTLCVNGNALVTTGYNMLVAPFLSTHTQSLVVMCEKGAQTLAALKSFLKEDEIPRCYGGSAPGSGPNDVLLESALFPEGLNESAQAFKERCLKKRG